MRTPRDRTTRSWRLSLPAESGFTLVELLVAMVILSVGVLGALAMMDTANAIAGANKAREGATGLAREIVEDARSIPYSQLSPNAVEAELQAKPGSADQSPSDPAWTINRRNHTYTVTATVCSVDDAQDGVGVHSSETGANSSGAFCADPAPTTPGDDIPDDYKRVVVNVSWTRGGETQTNRQATVVPNPGSAAGPQITALESDATDDAVHDSQTDTVTYTATTSMTAASVRFLVDGTVVDTVVPSGGTTASFTLDLGAYGDPSERLDDTYQVAAQAVDARGQEGAVRYLTLRLNRRPPRAVEDFVGGWNATRSVVDFDWKTSNEADVTGYRVYRVAVGPDVLACSTADPSATSCTDTAPTAQDAEDYYVVALDTGPQGAPREGIASTRLTARRTDDRPRPPAALTAMSTSGGVRLAWEEPLAAQPDYSGSAIRFYRVYRDGVAIGDRYQRTGSGDELSLLDTEASAEGHSYWVSAVDQNYSESVLLGPVTP